jgi:hypothetical protein
MSKQTGRIYRATLSVYWFVNPYRIDAPATLVRRATVATTRSGGIYLL